MASTSASATSLVQGPLRVPGALPAAASGPSPAADAGKPQPLYGSRLAIGAVALSLATFMNVLDTSIANVSIPSIAGDLGVSPDQGTWVITSFGVANAISLPLTGWLTRRYGQVRLFTASVMLFVVASFLCGLAPSLQTLILFRVLQGAVAGPMIPLSQSLLLSSYPPSKAGSALAIWAITTLVAPVVGPVLGGWITDNIAWPWIFYINVPIGIVAGLATWAIYRKRETPTHQSPIDAVGLALLVVWVGALQVMLDQGKDLDWFSSPTIVGLGLVAVVGFAFFLVWELTEQHPIVDLTLFARRNYWTSTLSISLGYGAYFASVVLVPLWLQQYMGYTATWAGIALAPVGVLAIALTPLVGRTVNRFDQRLYVTVSFLTFALVNFLRARFDTDVSLATILVPTVIQGIGVACFFVPLVSLSLSGLSAERVPAASGLLNFCRITAGSFGTSIVTTAWDRRATLHHSQLVDHLTAGSPVTGHTLNSLQASGFASQQSEGLINRIVDQQAFMSSADDIFYASALLFIVLIAVIWLARPAQSTAGSAEAAAGAH
jgi:MFS transporter, DHA2 family, multidrug resistance protein